MRQDAETVKVAVPAAAPAPEEDVQETVETVSEPKANRTVPPTTFVTGRTSRISGMEGPKDRSSF